MTDEAKAVDSIIFNIFPLAAYPLEGSGSAKAHHTWYFAWLVELESPTLIT